MKSTIASMLFILFVNIVYAQTYFLIDFEDLSTTQHYLTIDSISNPDNSWQIGKPNKSFFTEAYSLPNAIVTDTVNSYPMNDSSSFIITHYANYGFVNAHTAVLNGRYRVDSDSLHDFGKIEFSSDNGISWIDLINDTIYPPPIWGGEKPVLTGTGNWTFFSVELAHMGFEFELGDTVFFRFTFISDEIDNHRDGLMFDDIAFGDAVEGIEHSRMNDFDSKIFPNPSNQIITIEFENSNLYPVLLEVFDDTGRIILQKTGGQQGYFEIDISTFRSSCYLYRIVDHSSNRASYGKFIVN